MQSDLTIHARWERHDDKALLWAGRVLIVEVTPHEDWFRAIMGCRIFASGGITEHETLDAAIDAVNERLGVKV